MYLSGLSLLFRPLESRPFHLQNHNNKKTITATITTITAPITTITAPITTITATIATITTPKKSQGGALEAKPCFLPAKKSQVAVIVVMAFVMGCDGSGLEL